ncbi:MAG: OmpA family protein [Acidobacteriaceae bacterium]|nr:OmpA family protein [Acidobacteriaceae bacterium]
MKRLLELMEKVVVASAGVVLAATLAFGFVTPNTKTFTAGQEFKAKGVIVSREGNIIKLRGDDDTIGTVELNSDTKIQLKHGAFSRKTAMSPEALVPGLQIEAQGKGDEKGDLVATRVIFDPNSMRASRQIDTRVAPIEAKEASLDNRTGSLEGRAGQLETRAGQLEDQQRQTQQQVGQVKTEADQANQQANQANQGVSDVNTRVTNLDNYQVADSKIVYFKINSSTLSSQAKQDLDEIAEKAKSQKGYVLEVAGYADKTGPAALNQTLSEQRADAVVRYLEQNGDIPIHRILRPAAMGTSHEAEPNNTAAGRKANRRVEVKMLVNQGVVGGANGAAVSAPSTSASK